MLTMKTTRFLSTAAVGFLVGTTATAALAATNTTTKALENDSYVALSGTVGEITDGDEFMLNTASGSITVDTNDEWPGLFKSDVGRILSTGDKVTVTGRIDENLFTQKELEAYSLSHEGESFTTYYYNTNANDYDYSYNSYDIDYDDDTTRLSGVVTKINGDNTVILNYTGGSIQVDLSETAIPDTDLLRLGDRITVYGEVDNDWFTKKEFEASRVTKINTYPSS